MVKTLAKEIEHPMRREKPRDNLETVKRLIKCVKCKAVQAMYWLIIDCCLLYMEFIGNLTGAVSGA